MKVYKIDYKEDQLTEKNPRKCEHCSCAFKATIGDEKCERCHWNRGTKFKFLPWPIYTAMPIEVKCDYEG